MASPPLGVYVHFPFCAAICPYCDFNVYKMRDLDADAWADAYCAELRHAASLRPHGPVETLFFGGGTPSLMPVALVAAIIDEIDRLWGFAEKAEISLEANPEGLDAPTLQDFAACGITRLSLGVQSLDDAALAFLGRHHSAAQAMSVFALAQNSFPSSSLDLIYARPGQTLAAWEQELARALSLAPQHMSLYQLTFEPETAFGLQLRQGRLQPPEEELAVNLFEHSRAACAAAGLPAYEISNHARPDGECRHNVSNWQGGDYAGIGPGAHGRLSVDGVRHASYALPTPNDWLQSVAAKGHGWQSFEPLDDAARHAETLLLGLRLTQGIAYERLSAAGLVLDGARLADMQAAGLIVRDATRLAATPEGCLVLDRLVAELLL